MSQVLKKTEGACELLRKTYTVSKRLKNVAE